MGGVRGDVVALNFIQTVIMEMGEPPSVQAEDPGMWVQSRQYSGRIVTVSNATIFDSPVYNYTRDLPYIWEEMHLPISYKDDRRRAEQILLHAAQAHTVNIADMAEPALRTLEERFFIKPGDLKTPRLLAAHRPLGRTHRPLSNQRPRHPRRQRPHVPRDHRRARPGPDRIASGTYEIVGMPPVTVRLDPPVQPNSPPAKPA